MESLHERLGSVLSALEAGAGETRGRAGTWSVRDVLSHMARWDDLKRSELESELAGSPPQSEPDYRILNARWLADDADLPLAVARERFRGAHEAYRSLLASVHDDRWEVARRHAEWTVAHYERHVRAPLEFEVQPGG